MGGGFGGGATRGRARTRGPVVGDDLRFDLEIDFKTAVFGGDLVVSGAFHVEAGPATIGGGTIMTNINLEADSGGAVEISGGDSIDIAGGTGTTGSIP